ncbi:hypothetical protein [Streptomyces sp. NPDC050528]
MERLALWEAKGDGSTKTHLAKPVTDQQYNGPHTRELPHATS